jgi:hypothetical protein
MNKVAQLYPPALGFPDETERSSWIVDGLWTAGGLEAVGFV